MGRLYIYVCTSNWLLAWNITSGGTLVSNPVGLSDEVNNAKNRDKSEISMHWEQGEGDLTLCAYTSMSNSKVKKNVLVLLMMRSLMGITQDDGKKRKPAIINFYDFTKGGTDILDQKTSKYLCKSVTHRWTTIHFFFLLDTIRCNALTMYAIKRSKPFGKISAFGIGWDLVMSLVKPFIEIRPTVGLRIGLRSKISAILGGNLNESVEAEAYEYSCFGKTKQWYNISLFHISGQNQKKKKDSMKKLKSRCQKYGKPVCDDHLKLVCEKHLS